jgi:hypothetical protein
MRFVHRVLFPMRPLPRHANPGSLTPPRNPPAVRQIRIGADQWRRTGKFPGTRLALDRPCDPPGECGAIVFREWEALDVSAVTHGFLEKMHFD